MTSMREELANKTSELEAWEAEKSRYQSHLTERNATILSLSQSKASVEFNCAELRASCCAEHESKSRLETKEREQRARVEELSGQLEEAREALAEREAEHRRLALSQHSAAQKRASEAVEQATSYLLWIHYPGWRPWERPWGGVFIAYISAYGNNHSLEAVAGLNPLSYSPYLPMPIITIYGRI